MENVNVWQINNGKNGCFVVAKNGEVQNTFNSIGEALEEIREEYESGDFLSVGVYLA
jgi:hypothetical protein